jgi:hypothetical protein
MSWVGHVKGSLVQLFFAERQTSSVLSCYACFIGSDCTFVLADSEHKRWIFILTRVSAIPRRNSNINVILTSGIISTTDLQLFWDWKTKLFE